MLSTISGAYSAYWSEGDATLCKGVRGAYSPPPPPFQWPTLPNVVAGGRYSFYGGEGGLLCPLFLGPTLLTGVGGRLLCLRG